MCRLCMARGVNKEGIRPLIIQLINKGSIKDNMKPILMVHKIDENMINYVDKLIDYNRNFKKDDLDRPIIWKKKK